MDPEQYDQILKMIEEQNKLLKSINWSTSLFAIALILGLLFGGFRIIDYFFY